MSKGVKRAIIGAAFLALAGRQYDVFQDFKVMTPNQIADEIHAKSRQEIADARLAIAEKKGPVFDVVLKDCKEEERKLYAARASMPVVALILEEAADKRVSFDMDKCVQGALDEKMFWMPKVPDQGAATEKFKESVLAANKNAAFGAGALGGVLLLSSAFAFRRGRKQDTDDAPPPPTMA